MRRLPIWIRSQERRKLEWRKQYKSKQKILLLLQDPRAPTRGVPERDQGKQALPRCARTNLLAEDLFH